MRIFSLEAHCSVIEDVKRQLQPLGHQVDCVNLTGHTFVFGIPKVHSFGSFKLDYIWDYSPEKMRAEHPELEKYDAFMVNYPPLLIRKFEAFGKPMVMNACVRFDHYTCDNKERWESWVSWFKEAVAAKRLYPLANSLYDQAYMKYFSGVDCPYIPSMCDYHGLRYSGENPTPLLWETRSEKLRHLFASELPEVREVRSLYSGRYEWSNLVKHKAIIHIPFNASQMSFFEHLSMGIPIFVPTPEYLVQLKFSYGALSEITDRQTRNNYPPGSWGKGTFEAPDPNEYNDPEVLLWWMRYYDQYTLSPYVIRFESLAHLRELLKTTDYAEVSRCMVGANLFRKLEITKRWDSFMDTVR